MLPRPRLLDELRRRWTIRVVAVVAGAGFGKSTLLAQAHEENRALPAGIDAAVRCGREPDAGTLAHALAAELGARVPDGGGVEELAEALAAHVAGHTPVPVCLTVDDVHLLPDDSSGVELLAELVEVLP